MHNFNEMTENLSNKLLVFLLVYDKMNCINGFALIQTESVWDASQLISYLRRNINNYYILNLKHRHHEHQLHHFQLRKSCFVPILRTDQSFEKDNWLFIVSKPGIFSNKKQHDTVAQRTSIHTKRLSSIIAHRDSHEM